MYTKGQMLLRISELRHMREEAAQREGATLTVRHLDKMFDRTEKALRGLTESSVPSGSEVALRAG